jgi:hypothetical protein
MIRPDSVPNANAPPEDHADFLERSVLTSSQRTVSLQDYVRDQRMANAGEVIADAGEGPLLDDPSEGLAEAAFSELDHRCRIFEPNTAHYPFEITPTLLRLRADGDESLYVFLALLSWYGKDAGPRGKDGEKIFEEVSAKAAEGYLGGSANKARSVVFGFPRRVEPKGFADALDALCRELGEGRGAHRNRPKLPVQKDGKLDVVAWIEFSDARPGKLIAFGQCATGDWSDKLYELPQPERWVGHWMLDSLTVLPVRSFFLPHRLGWKEWKHACTFGGLVFDRCRIAALASGTADAGLRKEWAAWSAHVLRRLRTRLA